MDLWEIVPESVVRNERVHDKVQLRLLWRRKCKYPFGLHKSKDIFDQWVTNNFLQERLRSKMVNSLVGGKFFLSGCFTTLPQMSRFSSVKFGRLDESSVLWFKKCHRNSPGWSRRNDGLPQKSRAPSRNRVGLPHEHESTIPQLGSKCGTEVYLRQDPDSFNLSPCPRYS